MTATKKRRQRLWADRRLQGALLVHTTIYWFYCLFSVTLIATCWVIFTHQPESSSDLFGQLWFNCGPALLGSVLLLPLVLLDCLRLSNRFAGPMVRMQRAMRELAQDGRTTPVELREGDYWSEFAEHFNCVMQRLVAAEQQPPTAQPSPKQAEAGAGDKSNTTSPCAVIPDTVPPSGEANSASIYSDLSI